MEEALYGALLEALGYAINQKSFRGLADKEPMAMLHTLREEWGSIRPLAIKAMLSAAAGLLPYVRSDGEAAVALKGLLRHLPRTGSVAADQPSCRPRRRCDPLGGPKY